MQISNVQSIPEHMNINMPHHTVKHDCLTQLSEISKSTMFFYKHIITEVINMHCIVYN